jgi:hypothetical protein
MPSNEISLDDASRTVLGQSLALVDLFACGVTRVARAATPEFAIFF